MAAAKLASLAPSEAPEPPPPAVAPTVVETGGVFQSGRFSFPMTKWSHLPAMPATPQPYPLPAVMADYLDFVVLTGVQGAVALRLAVKHFITNARGEMAISVPPGPKTASAPIRVSTEAKAFIERLVARARERQASNEDPEGQLFPVTYSQLAGMWNRTCRPILKEARGSGASLTALRLASARYWYLRVG